MILTAASVAIAGLALPPDWWQNAGILDANQATDDFAAVNVGQLKNTATNAIDHISNSLHDGAGDELLELVAQFRAQSPERDDFVAVNVGQLKNVAAPIYRRLIQARYATSFPWNDAATERDDFAAVNVGQLKQVFSFDLNRDSDEDHMPDLWEVTNGLNPQSPADATGDPDSDGITNLQEFSAGTDPQEHTIAPDTRPWAAIDWNHLDGVTFDFDPCGGSLLTRFRSDATPPSVAITHAALLRGDGGIRFKIAESGASFVLGFSQPPVNSVSLTPVYGFNVSTTGVTYFHPGGSAQLSSSVFLNAVSVQTSDVFCIERIRSHLVYSINGMPLLTIPAPPGKLGIVAQLNSVGLAAGCCEAWGHRPDINNDSMDDLWVQELLSSHPEVTPGSFTPESDADGDGLTNLEEFLNYLDPFNSDSNGDLVPDSFAINTADVDKDGLPAGAESFYGLNDSDPADAWTDLDGDGLANLREYLDRTNLNTPTAQIVDSDGDGMSDLFELRYWPTTSGSSYSAAMDFFNSVADSDADGVLNFEEAAFALDPLNRQTRPGSASDTLVLASHLPAGSTTGGSLPARQGYLDWDNDGLPDWKEHWANRYAVTQPAAPAVPPAPNTYHPSLPPYRSDPRTPQNPAALTDSDSDGVSDYMEVQNGSNPFNPDTDGDGTGDVFDGATYFPPGDPAQCVVLDTTYRQVERRFFSGLDVMIGGINTETNFGWFGYEAPAGSDPGGWKMSYPYWDLGTGYKSSRTISASGASVADMITLTELSMAAASQNCRVVYQHPWQTSAYCGAGTSTPGADFPTPTPPVSITSWAYGRSHMVLHFMTPEAAEARAGLTVQAIYTASDLDMFHDPNATATVTQHLQVPIGPDLRSAHYLRSPTPINTDASASSSGSTPETPEILARTSSLWITPTQPVPGLLSMNNATDEGWLLSNGEPINNRDWPATSNPGTGDWRTNNLNKAGGGISTTGLVEVPFLGIIPGSIIPQPWLIYEKVTPGHPLYDPENSQQQLHELAPTMTVNQSGTGRIRLYAVRDQGMTSEAVWEIPIPVGLATTIDLFPMLYSGRTTANTTPPVDTIPYGPNVRYWVEAVNSGPCKLHYGIKRVKTDGSGFEHHWEENTFVSLLPVEIKWEDISGNVDDNPDPWTNQTNGKRIMVGAPESDHNGDMRRELNVKVSIPGYANQPVYLKVFDPDDPSTVSDPSHVLDPNGDAGDDNMHAVGLGDNWGYFVPQASKKITVNLDSSGQATAKFKVNQQPGNNYRIAVAVKDSDLNVLQVTNPGGQGFVTADDKPVSGFSGAVTPMLTVWRTLYIEADSMAAITTPKESPDRVDAVGDHWATDSSGLQNRQRLYLAGSLPEGNNFYERGRLKAGGAEYKIVESGSNWVTLIETVQSTPAGFIGAVEIFDDDDRGLTSPALPKTGLITQGVKDIYKRAYIDVVERTQNPTKTIPFKLYTSVASRVLYDSSLNNAIDTDGDDTGAFWNHYLIAAYQPHKSAADDPIGAVTEGATLPAGFGVRFSVVFVETIRDRIAGVVDLNVAEFSRRLDEIVAHEIGHSPNDPGSFFGDLFGGSSHPESGLMADEAPQHHFSAESLKRFRQVYRWQDP